MSTPRLSIKVCAATIALAGLFGCGPTEKAPGTSAGRSTGTAVRALGGDVTPPTVSITSPAGGDVIRDIANITVAASDDAGPVVMAQLLVNGVAQQTDTQEPFAFTWDGTVRPEGTYELKIVAVDAAGNLGVSAPVVVTLGHVLATLTTPAIAVSGRQISLAFDVSGPVPTGAVLNLATSTPAVFSTFPATAPIGNGSGNRFALTTIAQSAETVAAVTATYQGTTKSVTVRLVPPSDPGLIAFSVNPTVTGGGGIGTGSINISRTVFTGTITVALASDNPAVVVPATATFPTNTTFASFPITTSAVGSPTTATVTATLGAGPTWSATVTLMPVPLPRVVSVTAPSTMAAGELGTGNVTLDIPAPVGGAVVALKGTNGDGAWPTVVVPLSVTVAGGATTASFPIATTPSSGLTTSNLAASLNGSTAGQVITIPRTILNGNATYDPGLRVPRCDGVIASCDTGNLVESRASMSPVRESNTPNTILNSCLDGPINDSFSGPARYRVDRSIERLNISTTDGSALAPGKTVNITVVVWASGRLGLWSAPDANNPVWTLISSQQLNAGIASGPLSVTIPFTLPAGTLQAIRANYENRPSSTTPISCTADQYEAYQDSDDVVFSTMGGPLPNHAPKADAGPDQTIGLPPIAILVGTTSDDGLPNPPAAFTTTWTKVSGPGTVTFTDPTAATTVATFSIAGSYVLQLTASDGELTTTDTVTVNVNNGGGPNVAPFVSAGLDQTITSPLPGGITLLGTATDDGKPNPPGVVTLSWSQVDGPAVVTFANPASPVSGATFPAAGTYTLRLTANDGLLSSSDDVVITFFENLPPVVNAGPDQEIRVDGLVLLQGSVTDDRRSDPLRIAWSQVSGPGTATFEDPHLPITATTFSAPGTYVLRLEANDAVLSASDDVVVIVNDLPNTAPMVNAGADQAILLNGAALLAGTASDDGRPNPPGVAAFTWSQVSGTGTAAFANANALQTTVTFSATGTYVLRLTANDGALATTDDVTVVVNPVPVNQAPVVDAGPDRTVTLPATAALAGTVTDDALPVPHVVTITWSKVSGPGTVTFANASAASTTASFSAAGTYVLQLRASDGALTKTDTMTTVVNPAITLKVQYRAVSPNATDNQIRAGLNIVNVGPTAVPLRELKIRYWYTVDTNRAQTVECEAAAIGCSRITAGFTTVSPTRPGADRFLEVGFTSTAGNLAAGAQTGEIRGRIRKDNLSNYNEGNDYSYAASLGAAPPTALVDWSRVTLYRNGVRVWGTEP